MENTRLSIATNVAHMAIWAVEGLVVLTILRRAWISVLAFMG